jgi:hypothetical protein
MRYIHTISICLLLLLSRAERLAAQDGVATLTKGRVTALLDRHDGRFSARTAEGVRMLFARDAEFTSHISVALDGEIYTNYPKSRMTAIWPVRNLGTGETETLADRIRCTWRLPSSHGERRVILELEAVSDSIDEELRVHVRVENGTTRPLLAGMTVMLDVCAGDDDRVRVSAHGAAIGHEVAFQAGAQPDRLPLLSAAYAPDTAFCRLAGPGVVPPDLLTVGRWSYHSDLGTAVYGYRASGAEIWDTALLLQWNQSPLAPGDRREAATAIGLTRHAPVKNATGSFAKEFVVPTISLAILGIVSDTNAKVHISTPFVDNHYEAASERNRYWDTTVTVTPDKPISVLLGLERLSRKAAIDSVDYYRQGLVYVRSDSDIGLQSRSLILGYGMDAFLIWPVSEWGSEHLYHGSMKFARTLIQTEIRDGMIGFTPSIPIFLDSRYTPSNQKEDAGKELRFELPGASFLNFSANNLKPYNHWSPELEAGALTADGTGDAIISDVRVRIHNVYGAVINPGVSGLLWTPRCLDQPSYQQSGREYVFVPFRQYGGNRTEDLLRIVAWEDGTKLRLYDATDELSLNRGEHIDTLLSTPTTIRASQPVMVYQHHVDWQFLGSDTALAGAAFTLLPPELWGTRYHVWTDDIIQENISWGRPVDYFQLPHTPPSYENLYLIIITSASNRNGVFIDNAPIDGSTFSVFGDYAYAYIDIQSGYHIVDSERPLLTVVCGGVSSPRYGKIYSVGMSWIPPFTSTPRRPATPPRDERTGERGTDISLE